MSENTEIKLYNDVKIVPISESVDLEGYKKISVPMNNALNLAGLFQQLPAIAANVEMSSMYSLSFPEGLPHTLMRLKNKGYSTVIQNGKGKILGTAALFDDFQEKILLSSFTAMSVATGQYFLAKINDELNIINQKIDKILEFLYGDKKAELLAEINFVKYAFDNYSSIMKSSDQRIATIGNIQRSKIVALKDIDFYLNDLKSTVTSDSKNANDQVHKVLNIKNSIDLSIQLFVTSTLLELLYSGNDDQEYIDYLSESVSSCIENCNKQLLTSLSELNGKLNSKQIHLPIGKSDAKPLSELISANINKIKDGSFAEYHKDIRDAINRYRKPAQYIMDTKGNVYFKTAC